MLENGLKVRNTEMDFGLILKGRAIEASGNLENLTDMESLQSNVHIL